MVTLSADELDELQCEQRRVGATMAVAIRVLGCALHDGNRDAATKMLAKIAELAEELHTAENPGEGAGAGGVTVRH